MCRPAARNKAKQLELLEQRTFQIANDFEKVFVIVFAFVTFKAIFF
jgi:hypothetical protein